jgi:hypothetical protein
MALSFTDEVRIYIQHRAEQNAILHAAQTGDKPLDYPSIEDSFALLADIGDVHTKLFFKVAEEIDKLRAAVEGR